MTRVVLAVIVILLLLAGILYATSSARKNVPPAIISMSVEKPDLVVIGANLDKVEVWAIPTGTNVTEADYIKIGDATLTVSGASQQWTLPIPAQQMLVTSIFAEGYAAGTLVGQVALPQTGATEIYNALWATSSSSATSTVE